jgi:uncharacterized membrane protein YqjE
MADDIRIEPTRPRGDDRLSPELHEPGLGDLFRQLAQDSAALIRQEVALARAEMRENLQSAMRGAVRLAIGGAVALVGALVLVAFLVLLVGNLIGIYWLGALIVGVVLTAAGAIMVKTALDNLSAEALKPEQTVETLKEDKEWLTNEIQDARRDLT